MKIKFKAFLWIAIPLLTTTHVNAQFAGIVTLSTTGEISSAPTNDGTMTITPDPVKFKINAREILVFLALDEYANGKYDQTNFPDGANLVLLGDIPSGSYLDFQVQDRNGGELADVSDIIKLNYGTNVISSGKVKNSTGLYATSFTQKFIQKFSYDSSSEGGTGFHFYLQGSAACKVTDSKLSRENNYVETQSDQLAGNGDGTFQGQPFVLTGDLNIIESHSGHIYPDGGDEGGGTITTTIIPPPLQN